MKKFIIILAFFFLTSVSLSSVLLLYKGSEEGYGESILSSYIVPKLVKMGIKYDMLDIEKGIPNLKKYDLVVSCYYSSSMRGASKYLKALSDYLAGNGKLLIINSLGAFSEKDKNSPSPTLSEINSVLNFLGIGYSYGWREIFVTGYHISPKYQIGESPSGVKRDFENYEIFSPTVKVILKAITPKGVFPVGFIGKKGGLFIYDHAFNEEGAPFVNFGRIVEDILTSLKNENTVLIIGDSKDAEMAFRNVLFDIWKKKMGEYSKFKAVILVDGKYPIKDEGLSDYVKEGGVVILISQGNEEAQGILTMKKIALLPADTTLGNVAINYIQPPKNAEIFIKVGEKNVGWILRKGKGGIVFFPKNLLNKSTRGYLFNAFLEASHLIVSPIVNSYTIFLDDFPLPAYGVKYKRITKEFGDVTDGEFYYEIWWKDIKTVAKELSLKLTTALVTNYGTNTEFFNFAEFLQTRYPVRALSEILKDPLVELGLHGYNHLSPISKNWSFSDLLESYKALKAFIGNFSETYIPITFVAPNNKIDNLGVRAVKAAFPFVKIIGTDYGDSSTLNEFELVNDVVVLPRTTSGYYPVEKLVFESVSAVLNFGTFQYFIHPDDLIDKYRNPKGLSWKDMKASMKAFLIKMKRYFPWLENNFGFEAALKFEDYFTKKPYISYEKGCIKVTLPKSARLPRFFYLKSTQPVHIQGGMIAYKYNNVDVLKMISDQMSICRIQGE